jgi:D-xylose transport system permease protein
MIVNAETLEGPAAEDEFAQVRNPALAQFRSRLATKYRLIPVLVVLAAIWILFGILSSSFLTARNFSDLSLQITTVAILGLGLALALIVAEIDLSVAATSAVCAAVFGQIAVQENVNPIFAIIAALASGAAIGWLNGTITTRFNVPSFIVTLGGSFILQGVLLLVLPQATEQITLTNLSFAKIATDNVSLVPSLVIVAAAALVLVFNRRHTHVSKRGYGLKTSVLTDVLLPVVALVVVGVAVVLVLNSYEGVPLLLVITIAFYAVMGYVMARTKFGLHLYAVGGSKQAAERAGINVKRVKTTAFALCNAFAAVAGILAASRVLSVGVDSADTTLILQAAAACIIGGISLFGGRGSPWCALAGALVIGSVEDGLLLLSAPQQTQYIAEGALLVGAVLLDQVISRSANAD